MDVIIEECLSELSGNIPEDDFAMWVAPLKFLIKEDKVIILAASDMIIRWVKKNYEEIITKIFSGKLDHDITIQYGVGTEDEYSAPAVVEKKSRKSGGRGGRSRDVIKDFIKESAIETSNLNHDFTFNNFVEGKSNQFALAACAQVAQHPGTSHNPLFIYGSTGLGKTHLMHAVGNSIREKYPDARLIYQHCDSFIEDIVRSFRNNTHSDLRHFYKTLDALLIDDIQLLAGKDTSQEVFFHTFNTLLDGGHQVILTCDRYPKELEMMEDRLKSRFASGLIVNIEPPELEHRIAILLQKAENWGLNLPQETAFFIAQTVKASVRELEGALKQVNALANFKGSPLSVSIAQDALGSLMEIQSRQITLTNIQKVVTTYYGLKTADLTGKSRAANIAKPRQLAMYVARLLTQHSLPEIGRAFERDHSTVMHACRKVETELKKDYALQRDFETIRATLTH
ncbi:chromosomal replication initiator protein DnaA [Wohlfahrtiimonas sp. G9077]|uniref:chromosomal replication initiator protein DnaA n=1 Tax=Wohlfahrtiimonas sp. G9077 TaxID=1980118 RepID=UPI000B99D15A|nr:chromosomal replication initiator protein DnaA [Wohlfahrtiimonas sp. G9077]OYQ73772.1 chromosomal replication initiation protein [Wohlfahrtiimonas sp. G9077]